MTENPNDPLTPVELFRRGIKITREIRNRIEEARAYYLGRSSREPAQPLSEIFDPMHGPIIPYFVKIIRMLTHPQAYLTLRQSAARTEFERESVATLDGLRRLSIDLAPLLDADDRQKTISRQATGRATDEPTDQPSQNRRVELRHLHQKVPGTCGRVRVVGFAPRTFVPFASTRTSYAAKRDCIQA